MKFGTFLLIIFLFLVISFVLFVIYGSKISFLAPYRQKFIEKINIFKTKASEAKQQVTGVPEQQFLVSPPSDVIWCKLQDISVGSDDQDPDSDKIVGWDDTQKCCVRETKGFDCAIHQEVTLDYCFTGNVGGKINYITINGYYANTNYLSNFTDNIDKMDLPNKPCSADIYPTGLKV